MAEEVAREAGRYAHRRFHDRPGLAIGRKGPHDEVSDADRETEALIRRRIAAAFPDDAVLGEEAGMGAGSQSGKGNGWLWVLDPIDGTACFVAGIPVWCVSIAATWQGRGVIGVIEDPNAGETFSACSDGPALLNGSPIRASDAADLGAGSVGIGYSTRIRPDQTLSALTRLLEAGGMFQRNGSGALMLAYVAAGRLIGYYEPHINAWDCLAALVLVEQAGGWHNDFLANDGLARGNPVLAAAPGLAAELRRLFDVG
ncbi:MAG: inositol monophosphatase family protein [Alphaproteobacteria bacterium]